MKYILFKEYYEDLPFDMLAFKEDVSTSDVQEYVHNLKQEWDNDKEHYEEEYGYLYDFILERLTEQYDVKVLFWDNEKDIVYF